MNFLNNFLVYNQTTKQYNHHFFGIWTYDVHFNNVTYKKGLFSKGTTILCRVCLHHRSSGVGVRL